MTQCRRSSKISGLGNGVYKGGAWHKMLNSPVQACGIKEGQGKGSREAEIVL